MHLFPLDRHAFRQIMLTVGVTPGKECDKLMQDYMR